MNRVIALAVCVVMASSVTFAADVTSINDGLWTSVSTWDLHIPTASDAPWVANGKTVTVNSVITTGASQYLSVGNWSATSGTLTIASTGSLTLTTAGIYDGCGGTGVINVNGGSISCPYAFKVGWYGNGTVNLTAGLIAAGGLYVGNGSGHNSYVNISGGILTCSLPTPGLIMQSDGHINITHGKLILPGTVTNIASFGDVKAYSGAGTFVYDTATQPGYTVISAIPEPATVLLLGTAMLFARKRK